MFSVNWCCALLMLCMSSTHGGAPLLGTEHGAIVYGTLNEPLQLSCATPNDSLPIAWYRNQVPISLRVSSERVAVEQGSLVITSLDLPDSGWYTCATSNTFGRAEIDFLVFVRGPPIITFSLSGSATNVQVEEGTRVELPCRYSGTPHPTPRWFQDDHEITDGEADNRYRIDYTTGSLVIFNIARADTKSGPMDIRYRCNVSSEGLFQLSDPIKIKLINPPISITSSPIGDSDQTSINILSSETATLTCTDVPQLQDMVAAGDLEIKWFRDNSELTNRFGRLSITVNGSGAMSSGYYCCEVKQNVNGTRTLVNNYCITVAVRQLGSFTNLPVHTAIQQGRNLHLFCMAGTANGLDPPIVEWTNGSGVAIPNEPRITMVQNAVGYAYVVIENVQVHTDDGSYMCLGRNFAGTIDEGINVTIAAPCGDSELQSSTAEMGTVEGWEFGPGTGVTLEDNEWVFELTGVPTGLRSSITQSVEVPFGTERVCVSGRILTLSEHTPVINLSVSSGESLQLAPPFPAVQGWQWVSGEVGISGAEGGSVTVELTVPVLDSGQSVVVGNALALFDDLSVNFVVSDPVDTTETDSSSDSPFSTTILAIAAGGAVGLLLLLLGLCTAVCCCCCRKKKTRAKLMKKMSMRVQRWTLRRLARAEHPNDMFTMKSERGTEGEAVYAEVTRNHHVTSPTSISSLQVDEDTYYIQTVDSIPDSHRRSQSGLGSAPPTGTDENEYHNVTRPEENYAIASLHAMPAQGPNEYLQLLPPNNQYLEVLPPSSPTGGGDQKTHPEADSVGDVYSFVNT